MNQFARAKSYIDRMPGAVSGSGGHDQTFAVACCVVRFGLNEGDQWSLLTDYNTRCSPPWAEKDLRHKLNDARKRVTPGTMSARGYRNGASPAPAKPEHWRPLAPVTSPAPTAEPRHRATPQVVCPETSPADLPEPIQLGALALLRTLYLPDEHVRICKGRLNDDGKEQPEDAGVALPAREWIAKAEARKGDLASLWSSTAGAGVFIAMNPVTPGGKRDDDVTAYRFALVESDLASQEEQWARICIARVPCAAVIDSAGKSVHAWVKVDAKDRREYDERVAFLHAYFPGVDPKNKNPGRLSRLPDAARKGKRQRLLALNLGCASWSEWMTEIQRQSLGPARSFADLCNLDTTADPNCVIGFRDGKTLRYLCRGKSAWLLGPSGIGKSSLEAQFAVGWAIGAPVYGITPARPLRSLIVQAENDDYDLAEMVQGVAHAHGLHPDDDRWKTVTSNVLFRTETSSFGARFCARLRDMIDADRPDIVWVDPLLSFAGIDVSKQDQVTPFLREQLTPVLESTGAVMIGVHHTGKPKDAKATRDWTAIDWAYAGIGSSELVNWARAVMLLRPAGDRLYELKLAKRGSRAGATNPDGSTAYGSVWLQQAVGRIYWEQVNPPEEPIADEQEAPKDGRKARGGVETAGGAFGTPGAPDKATAALSWPWLDLTTTLPVDGVTGSKLWVATEDWMLNTNRRPVLSRSTFFSKVLPALVETHRLTRSEGKYFRPSTTSNPPVVQAVQ